MAELVGIISGSVGIASFAAQIGERVIKLKEFWSKVKNAPDQMKYVMEELETYSELLSEIERQQNIHALPNINTEAIRKSTKLCRSGLCVLSEVLNDMEGLIKRHRVCGGISFVLKESTMDIGRTRLEYARNLLHTSYTVYCTALNHHNIELQHKSIELQRRTLELQLLTADQSNAKLTKMTEMISNAERKANDIFIKQHRDNSPKRMPIAKFTWIEYFVGSVSYQKQICRTTQSDHQYGTSNTSYNVRIRIPGWWKPQIWDFYVSQAISGWTSYFQVCNIVPSISPQFMYTSSGQSEKLRDLLLSGQASLYDRDEEGNSLLYYAACASQPETCQLLLDMGGFEHERGFQDGSPMDAIPFANVDQFEMRTARCFEILLKHSEPILTDDDLDITSHHPGLYFPQESLRTLLSLRHKPWNTEPLSQRLFLLRHLLRAQQFSLYGNIDRYIEMIYLALGSYTVEDTGPCPSGCLCLLLPTIADLMARSIYERHTYGLCEARQLLKTAVKSGAIMTTRGSNNPMLRFLKSYLCFRAGIQQSEVQEIIQAWVSELMISGVDLIKYGLQQKFVYPRIAAFYQTCGSPCRSIFKRLDLGDPDLLFSYGSTPDQWNVYFTNPCDEYAGAFWCMVETPPQKIPGSWEFDETLYERWESRYWNDEVLGTT